VTGARTRVALVTGANRGLGLETSRKLLAKGLHVVLTGRDVSALEAARKTLVRGDEHTLAVHMDVTDAASIRNAQRLVAERFGAVDILVNNAAVLLFEGEDALSIPSDAYRSTFETNVLGAIETCRVFAPAMARAIRPHRQCVVRRRPAFDDDDVCARVFDVEGGAERVYADPGGKLSGQWRARQRGRPGLGPHRHGRRVGAALAAAGRRHDRVAGDARGQWSDGRILPRSPAYRVVDDIRKS
jgi:NAD(P)-dependent dehydrogenase (short-subunit alcohol dehydrogenase family)